MSYQKAIIFILTFNFATISSFLIPPINPNCYSYRKTHSKRKDSTTTPTSHVMMSSSSNNYDNNNKSNLLVSTAIPKNTKIILASKSPRRAEILNMMGLQNKYQIQPSPLNEERVQVELQALKIKPADYVQQLAERKCTALVETLNSNDSIIIIGSDTIVDLNGIILEKPNDEKDAFDMLTSLSDQWHEVHTGVSITHLNRSMKRSITFSETSQVKFYNLSSRDIDSYISTGEPMDKAGAYGIQGIGGQLVEEIKGDFFNIMGLPMHRLSVELSKIISVID